MWSQTRDNGSVRYFERYTNYLTGQVKVASVTLKRPNNSQAMRLLAKKIEGYKVTAPPAERWLTLSDLMDDYLAANKEFLKESTYTKKVIVLRQLEKILGGRCHADRLTADYVKLKLEEHDKKACTRNERIKHIKALYRWAYQEGVLTDIHWIDRLNCYPDRKRDRISEKYLEKDELTVLLREMKDERWNQLTAFLVLSGMRIGEALALTPKDIDLDARSITIDKTYVITLKKVTPPKTHNSYREIYIQDELLALISGVKFGNSFFFEENGRPYSYEAFNKYFTENTERILGRRLTPHALRHTACSLWAADGIPWETIARRLGHGADAKITKEVYFHVTSKLRNREAAAFNSISMID